MGLEIPGVRKKFAENTALMQDLLLDYESIREREEHDFYEHLAILAGGGKG